MKFHHGQKVLIIGGYYSTYKGYIIGFRDNKGKLEYNIDIKLKKNEKKQEFISEDNLKVAWF